MTSFSPIPDSASNRLRLEILLFSSYLTRLQCATSRSHPYHDELPLFMDLTTLLAIGNATYPKAENVNAAIGIITNSALDLLILVENAPQDALAVETQRNTFTRSHKGHRKPKAKNTPDLTQRGRQGGQPSAAVEDPGCASNLVGGTLQITPVAQRGRALLSRWDELDFVAQGPDLDNDFSFTEHSQDLLSVISVLDPSNPDDLERFQLFSHHRAYRKLGWRVIEFNRHWGLSPFKIVSDNIDPDLAPHSESFESCTPDFHVFLRSYVLPDPPSVAPFRYSIVHNNASSWIAVMQDIWDDLGRLLLEPNMETIRTTSPSDEDISHIVASIMAMEALLPVLKHFLRSDGIAQALASAEALSRLSRSGRHNTSQDPSTQQDFTESEDINAGFSSDDHSPDISQSSVLGLLRSIRTVLAWQTSARHIFKKARSFQTSVPAFYRYCYHNRSLQPIPIAVNVATTLLDSWHAQRTDDSKLPSPRFVLNIALRAKVHCEATLMHWIATVQDVDCRKDWPIGVSKKSCQLCWWLHEAYNKRRGTSSFILPGSHGSFFPWLPPLGLPEDILSELHTKLQDHLDKLVRAHSRHSSVSSATSNVPRTAVKRVTLTGGKKSKRR